MGETYEREVFPPGCAQKQYYYSPGSNSVGRSSQCSGGGNTTGRSEIYSPPGYAPSQQSSGVGGYSESSSGYYSSGEPAPPRPVYFKDGTTESSKSSPARNYNLPDTNNSGGFTREEVTDLLLNHKYIDYNRYRGLVRVFAGYDLILPVVAVSVLMAAAAGGNYEVVEHLFANLVIYSGQFIMGVCLAIGLLKESTTSTEAYCRWWLRGSYVLTTLLGVGLVSLSLQYFASGDWRIGMVLVVFVGGVFFVPRVLGLILVRMFMADLRTYRDQKEQVLNTLVVIGRSRGIVPAHQQHQVGDDNGPAQEDANNVNRGNPNSDDTWVAYIPAWFL